MATKQASDEAVAKSKAAAQDFSQKTNASYFFLEKTVMRQRLINVSMLNPTNYLGNQVAESKTSN